MQERQRLSAYEELVGTRVTSIARKGTLYRIQQYVQLAKHQRIRTCHLCHALGRGGLVYPVLSYCTGSSKPYLAMDSGNFQVVI